MVKITPTPWEIVKSDDEKEIIIIGGIKADCYENYAWLDVSDNDAQHIVNCVNSHDQLLETIQAKDAQIAELEEQLESAQMDGQDMAKNEYREVVQSLEEQIAELVDKMKYAVQQLKDCHLYCQFCGNAEVLSDLEFVLEETITKHQKENR